MSRLSDHLSQHITRSGLMTTEQAQAAFDAMPGDLQDEVRRVLPSTRTDIFMPAEVAEVMGTSISMALALWDVVHGPAGTEAA